MCSMYWNLTAQVECPSCKQTADWNLQTHFEGDVGRCVNWYKLGEPIPELGGMTVTLNGENDDFCGDCPNEACGVWFDFGAEIVDGKVMRVFVLEDREPFTLASVFNGQRAIDAETPN